jgi:hypothetical protein
MGKPEQRLKSDRDLYPAMQLDEILAWQKFLELHQAEYDSFDYNLQIGSGVDPGSAFPDNIRQSAIAIRSLRLAAVGWQGDTPSIFEVKRRAGLQNIGRPLLYRAVWQAQQLSAVPPKLVLVTSEVMQYIVRVVPLLPIQVVLVPNGVTELKLVGARRQAP